jgi:hypothetical protein
MEFLERGELIRDIERIVKNPEVFKNERKGWYFLRETFGTTDMTRLTYTQLDTMAKCLTSKKYGLYCRYHKRMHNNNFLRKKLDLA